jgi:tRNA (guanine-N7-)-methyltransferase
VGKHKLARWAELGTFSNVIQPEIEEHPGTDHPVKGNWNNEIFHNSNPIILELGCGKGEYTVGLARRFPQNNFIGIDIKGARMWRGAKTADEKKIPNAVFLRTRIEFINSFFAVDEVDEIWITFPDPHPAKRNSNKRLSCPWFLNNYRNFLKNGGIIHLKTDNPELYNYSKHVAELNELQIVAATNDLYNEFTGDDILSIRTHYETIFLNEGKQICYLAFRLGKDKTIVDERTKTTG